MNFALLGCDPDTLELAKAVARSDEHRLVWAHDLGQFAPAIRAASPGVLIAEHWEGLLAGATADVVIVSRSADQEGRTEQLRKLAQAGTTMIVSHPVLDSMLVYYELDMIRQESHAVMLPYVPESSHPAWRRLAELIGDRSTGPLGVLEQIVIEHSFVTRGRSDVLHGFVRDMELVRPLAGAINKVSAMTSAGVRSSPEAINYGTLSVQMSGTSNVLVRWSVLAADAESSRFTLLGARGRAVLDAVKTGPWQLEVRGGQTGTESIASGDADAALRELAERLQQGSGPACSVAGAEAGRMRFAQEKKTPPASDAPASALPGHRRDEATELNDNVQRGSAPATAMFFTGRRVQPGLPDWIDACRTMELADAADHSLQRGRTIELFFETPTEQATFKGVMSGIGCLLLIAGLLVLVVATTAVHAGVPLADYWPFLLLGVLVVFLVLQALRLVFPVAPPPIDDDASISIQSARTWPPPRAQTPSAAPRPPTPGESTKSGPDTGSPSPPP